MKGADLVWKNALQFKKHLDAIEKKRVKAGETATKVEGFRLSRKLKKDVREARPGGIRLTPLSQIARRTKTGKRKKNARKPLASLAHLVRYKATRPSGKFNVEVGFVAPKMKTRNWMQLVGMHQKGESFDILYSGSRSYLGRRLANIGGRLKKAGDPDARFFFLRKTAGYKGGRRGQLPARPEIDPFWKANKGQAQRNITNNWERKMAGERI